MNVAPADSTAASKSLSEENSKADSLHQEESVNTFCYKIPDWFRKYNILTKTDLDLAKNKLSIVEEVSEDIDISSKKSDGSNSHPGLELSRKAYQDVYELAASTLVPTDASTSSDAKLPVLLLRGTDIDGGDVLDGLVRRLAQDLDATLVSLAMYDLEDLGRAFQKQVDDGKGVEEPVLGGQGECRVDVGTQTDSPPNDDAQNNTVRNDNIDDTTQADKTQNEDTQKYNPQTDTTQTESIQNDMTQIKSVQDDSICDDSQNKESKSDTSPNSDQHDHEQNQELKAEHADEDHQKAALDTSDTCSENEVVYTPRSEVSNTDPQPEISTSPAVNILEDPQADNDTSIPIDQSKQWTWSDSTDDHKIKPEPSTDPESGPETSASTKEKASGDKDDGSDAASRFSEYEEITDVNELKDDPKTLDVKRFTTFATYYFSKSQPVQQKRNMKLVARPSRNRDAVKAIMDAALQKHIDQEPKEELKEANISGESVESKDAPTPSPRHIFVSLRSVFDILENPWTEHILATIRDKIDEWRKEKNVMVTLFASMFEDIEPFASTTKCTCRSCHSQKDIPNTREIDLRDDLYIEGSYVMTIHETSSAKNVAFYESNGSQILKGSNIRRLIQAIEGRLSKKDFLHLIGDEDRGHRFLDLEGCQLLARYQPDFEELKSYATMLRGRILKKGSLDVSDLEDVVRRLVLDHTATCIFSQPNVETANGAKEKKDTSFKQMIAKVREKCRGFEKDLLDCVVDPETINTTYKDVIIDATTKTTLHRLINVSKLKFKQESHRLLHQLKTKGVLFYGPPGTGKTHLSRAIAKNSGANMLAIDGADVTHKWVGDTEKYIKAAFSVARKLHPCVLFMDEVESLLYRRGESDRSWRRAALTQFLQEIDGLSTQKDAPFLICATNRPDDLDQAFLRRLPNKILFAMPNREERERIIRLHLDEGDFEEKEGLTVEGLARMTRGYSGSDLYAVCQQAAWAWMEEQIDSTVDGITDDDHVVSDDSKVKKQTEKDQNSDTVKKQDEKTSKVDNNEEMTTGELKLTRKHIDKALRMARPSVTSDSLRHLESFARRFNPDQVNRLLNSGVPGDVGCHSIYL